MAELVITIKDTKGPPDNLIDITCTGDMDISKNSTPAQTLANEAMSWILKSTEKKQAEQKGTDNARRNVSRNHVAKNSPRSRSR